MFPLGEEHALTKVFDVSEFYVFRLFSLFIFFARQPHLMYFFFQRQYSYFLLLDLL